jgi:nanoRNase/pAp phosphatase (c-di-AMP/oligoRNAs hydrolase)
MNRNYPFTELKQKIDSVQKILVLLPPRPNFDQVAAALSLMLSLEESGKTISVVCNSPMTVEFNHLVGVDRVGTKIQGSDLVISFNYSADQIEKVSYNDDNNRPNIVIQPKAGAPAVTESLANFSYAGANFDLVITVGVRNQGGLSMGGINLGENFIINIDNDPGNANHGQLNLVDLDSPSLSEIALTLINDLGFGFSVDIAQNLLDGIWQSTQGLTDPLLGADTYEAVAYCLRSGAQKPTGQSNKQSNNPVFTPKKSSLKGPELKGPDRPKMEKMENRSKEEVKDQNEQDKNFQPPADWFEPKIFRGTNVS